MLTIIVSNYQKCPVPLMVHMTMDQHMESYKFCCISNINRILSDFKDNYFSVQATPTLISRFGQDVLHRTLLSAATALRILAFGGESCPTMAQINHMRAADNTTAFYNLYGITEVSSWATCHRIDVGSGTEENSHQRLE